MRDIPEDIFETSERMVDNMPGRTPWMHEVKDLVSKAILAERERCTEICAAEREWGGNVEDAQARIEKGEPPRKIEGWNAPYEEEET